jgi:replicative DNA helicase Mcm
LNNDEIEAYWIQYLKLNCKKELGRIKAHYPLDRTLTIDLTKVLQNDLWQGCIDNPRGSLQTIEEAYQRGFQNGEKKVVPVIRFTGISKKKAIRDLRVDDEGKLLSISCLVKRVSPVLPKILKATFKCAEYHPETVTAQYDHIMKPRYCRVCKSKTFTYHGEMDVKINRQWVHVQENLEDLMGGLQPSTLRCEVVEDLCNQVGSGDLVVLNGVLKSIPKFEKEGLRTGKDTYFEVNSIERPEREFEGIDPTESEEAEIRELAKREDIFELLTDSIAPSILGMRLAKQAIVLQLFGGVARVLPDGARKRGYINIVIVTDPGMAKTELLKFVSRVALRSAYAVADTSSKVGLVAAVIKDEQTGQYVIEPGPYLFARGGIFCADEIGNFSKEDWMYIGELMENGECHVNKAGIHATLKSDAAFLGAGNPTGGRYDPQVDFALQIKIPEQNLSRTDLKILQTDDVSEEKDRELVAHIGRTFQKSFVPQKEFIKPRLLRKYIAFSQQFEPEITEAASKVLEDYYVKMRKESQNPGMMRMTLRQFNTLNFLGESYARLHLRKQVTVKDAIIVRDIFDMTYRNVNMDANGQLNPGRSEHQNRESLPNLVRKTIIEIGGDTKKASEMSIITALKKKGYDSDRVLGVIRTLMSEGRLSEPRTGLYKVE